MRHHQNVMPGRSENPHHPIHVHTGRATPSSRDYIPRKRMRPNGSHNCDTFGAKASSIKMKTVTILASFPAANGQFPNALAEAIAAAPSRFPKHSSSGQACQNRLAFARRNLTTRSIVLTPWQLISARVKWLVHFVRLAAKSRRHDFQDR